MRTTRSTLFLLLAWLLACACLPPCAAEAAAPLAPRALTTEYQVDPIGIGETQPRLAWKLAFRERNAVQSAYQIQAAATPGQLAAQRGLLWDSGRVNSDQSIQLAWGGKPLASAQRVVWRVRAWNGERQASAWSEPAFFETGLLDAADWQAQWITADSPAPSKTPMPALLLRKAFSLTAPVRSARLYVTSLGLYEISINGGAVGNDVLRPGWTSYDKRLQYQAYDVTRLLRAGGNAIGATVGDGWYSGTIGFKGRNNYGAQRALLLELRVTLADGSVAVVRSDGTWKSSTGPILESDIYNGETYDARLEKAGWTAPGYDDRHWQPAQQLDRTRRILVAQAGPSTRRIMELKPARILRTPQGDTVVDFGQNLVGWVRLQVRGPAGATVMLRHAEVLDKDGNFYTKNLRKAAQTTTYILKGGAEETYEPHFTFQGFRYVAVSGFPGQLAPDALTAVVVHSDMGPANSWTSSNELLNKLVQNTEWSQRGNFVDIPTDCPQRNERLGWTADVQVFARTATYNFNTAGFYTKWLRDLAADQKADGSVPFVIPDLTSRGKPSVDGAAGWGDAATVVPWTMYLAYGDQRLLAQQYASMKAWVDHVARLAPDGIWSGSYQYGDWLAYQATGDEARDHPAPATSKDLIASAYLAHSADVLARAASVLGRTEDAARYAALFAKVKAAFNREYVSDSARVGEGSQTAYALALRFNLLPGDRREQAARQLAAEIAVRKNHLTTGFLGTPVLLFALSDTSLVDVAYTLLLQDTYPSWLYPVKMGATTIWERWDGIKPDGSFQDPAMNSFNHYAYGAVVEWMYGVVAGIDTSAAAPGYKRSVIRPRPGAGLDWVQASVETLYGELASSWTKEKDSLRIRTRIPPNTRAQVVLPGARLGTVALDGKPLAGALAASARQDGADVILEVGAGEYEFSYPVTTPAPRPAEAVRQATASEHVALVDLNRLNQDAVTRKP